MTDLNSQTSRDLLARRVRLLRAARGWSQEVLAELSGVHRNYIGHIERAEINAGLDNIEKIAQAFDMQVHALLDFHDPGGFARLLNIEDGTSLYLPVCA
ncbi:MAG: helix-turn-helix domain-containing protein [Acidiferrobacterales bacterium]